MSGNLSSDSFQDTYETCRTKGLLFGEQRSTMAKFACLNMLDACDNHYHKYSTYHNGLGNCLIAVLQPTVLQLCYTHLWAVYRFHPLQNPLVKGTAQLNCTLFCNEHLCLQYQSTSPMVLLLIYDHSLLIDLNKLVAKSQTVLFPA